MLPLYDPTKETSVLAYAYPEQSNGLCLCFMSPHKYEVRYTQTEKESLAATWANKHLCEYLIRKRVLPGDRSQASGSLSRVACTAYKYREVLYTESYQKNLTNYAVVEVHCMLTWYASHWWCMQCADCSSGYNVSRGNFLIYLFVGQTFKNTSNIWVKFELCIYSQCECYVVDCNKQSEWLLEHHDWPLHEWDCTCSLQCW